jgi:hypothetical protein
MGIIEDLQRHIFNDNNYFFNELEERVDLKKPQDIFLNTLADEISTKLPDNKMIISFQYKKLVTRSSKKPEELVGKQFPDIRERICEEYAHACGDEKKCFEGEHIEKGAEVDALIMHDNDICLVEYQQNHKRVCYDFMKMYWIQQFANRDFEKLFVTTLHTVRTADGTTNYDKFNKHIAEIEQILDTLLPNWKIMEIVNPKGSVKKREICFKP